MRHQNSLINFGRIRAVKGIKEKAKRDIAVVESSDVPNEEKILKIKQLEDMRDAEIKQLKSPHILWSNR